MKACPADFVNRGIARHNVSEAGFQRAFGILRAESGCFGTGMIRQGERGCAETGGEEEQCDRPATKAVAGEEEDGQRVDGKSEGCHDQKPAAELNRLGA